MPHLNSKPKLAAFTLLEATLYVFLVAVIGGIVTSLTIQIYRFQIIVEDRAQINEDIRVLMKSIRDDMYLGDSLTVEPGGDLVISSTFNSPSQVRYYVFGARTYRQENSGNVVAITNLATNIQTLDFTDISTPSSAGVIRVHLVLSNYPQGPIKPEVIEDVTSTISLKFL